MSCGRRIAPRSVRLLRRVARRGPLFVSRWPIAGAAARRCGSQSVLAYGSSQLQQNQLNPDSQASVSAALSAARAEVSALLRGRAFSRRGWRPFAGRDGAARSGCRPAVAGRPRAIHYGRERSGHRLAPRLAKMTCCAAPARGRTRRSWGRCFRPSSDFLGRACGRGSRCAATMPSAMPG